jgi:thiol-disulfide isomerase/thioredoxin
MNDRSRLHLVGLLCFALALCAGEFARSDESSTEPVKHAVLRLAGGDFAVGELKDAPASVLRWQSPAFTEPFDFDLKRVRSVHFSPAAERPKPTGEYSVELAGGDLLFGSLVRLSPEEAEFEVSEFGRLHVKRSDIRRLLRWSDGADLIYLGPNGLTSWNDSSTKQAWREENGHLVTDQLGAILHGDFGLPARAVIEFEISWSAKPDFVLALGVNDFVKHIEQAFRFEVWEGELVVMRESDDDADVEPLQKIVSGAGRVHLQAYLDQEAGRLVVLSSAGKQLAELHVTTGKTHPFEGLRLINKRGNVRLEGLRISRWNGEPPQEVQADKSRVHRADGSIVYGEIKAFDENTRQFLIDSDGTETRVKASDVGSVVLSLAGEGGSRNVRASLHDGVRLSGNLLKVEGGRLWLKSPSITEPLPLPIAQLNNFLLLNPSAAPATDERRDGRLELPGVKLHGFLADATTKATQSCLVWKPRGSLAGSPLRHGVAGRVVYRDRPPPQPQVKRPQARQVRRGGLVGGMIRVLGGGRPATQVQAQPRRSPATRSLHLRTGDTIPCQVTSIDEEGVHFKSETSDTTFVAHEKVKAVELAGVANAIKVDKAKRKRLLTLPRIQRDNPPTHLIRATNGDYLRARIDQMDEEKLTVEVRLETKQLSRDYIARIIWLHDDELDPSKKVRSESESETQVQALRTDGNRLTFVAQQLSETTLSGKSEVLGTCRIELKEVDELLIGGAIEEAAAQLAYQKWKLQNAVEPKFVTADAAGAGRPSGTESALVGQPAPDFALDLLSGDRFRLTEQKGKIVVLDFWATWCGPCIQIMPEIERVVEMYKEQDVLLVAVNLQETPERIRSTLERLKLGPTVALDIDGVVADKYAATAIPQTVVVNRDGSVARLFVGGGPQYGEQLQQALEELVADEEVKSLP